MEKSIKNADAVARKLEPASTKVINERLEVARKQRQKKKEIVEKRKTKAMAIRHQKVKGGICLSSEEEENYKSDIRD